MNDTPLPSPRKSQDLVRHHRTRIQSAARLGPALEAFFDDVVFRPGFLDGAVPIQDDAFDRALRLALSRVTRKADALPIRQLRVPRRDLVIATLALEGWYGVSVLFADDLIGALALVEPTGPTLYLRVPLAHPSVRFDLGPSTVGKA